MRPLTADEELLYNDGERLLPGITHSLEELVRHQSSYEFFKRVIEEDLRREGRYGSGEVTIVDLGFGVGHGCKTLSTIPGSRVTGVDVASECLSYARANYGAPNIVHVISDIPQFIAQMPAFDYVVSRGVIEHVRDGINAMLKSRWAKRLMFDVPYDEPPDINQHHLISRITEREFAEYPDKEILYEEVSGRIYGGPVQNPIPNMIMCVASAPGLPRVDQIIPLPIPAWDPPPGMRAMATTIAKLNDQLVREREAAAAPPAPRSLLGAVVRRLTG